MILHDFECQSCGVVTEHLVSSSVYEIDCIYCLGTTKRVILQAAKPHWSSLAMGDSASPEAIDRFERLHKQQKAKEEKTYAEHGDYGPASGGFNPPLPKD